MNEERENNLAILSMLVKVSMVNGTIEEKELMLIDSMAERLNLSSEDKKAVLDGEIDVKIIPPADEWERIPYFQMCIMASGMSGHFEEEEILFCTRLGLELGLRDEVTEKVVELFKAYFPEQVPLDELRRAYQITHN